VSILNSINKAKNYIKAKAEQIKAAVTEDDTSAQNVAKKKKTTEPIKLVGNEAIQERANDGLQVEKTTKATSTKATSTKETKTNSDVDKITSSTTADPSDGIKKGVKSGKSGQVFNADFVMDKMKISKEKWAKMSEDERQKVSAKFMQDMIDWHKAKNPKSKFSVAEQYQLYMGRCKTKEDVEFLTRTCKYLDKDNQLQSVLQSHQYENSEFQTIAQRIIADDSDKFDESVKPAIHKEIQSWTNEGAEEAQAIAAVKANTIKDVNAQREVMQGYQGLHSEKVDMAISDNIGTYFRDENGNILPGSDNEKFQMELWQNGLKNAATEKARANFARNTYQLTKDNQTPASDIVLETGNEAYINAMAENAYNFDESTRDSVINKLENSGYDSVKNTLQQAKAEYEAKQSAEADRSSSVKEKTGSETASSTGSKKYTGFTESAQRIGKIINNNLLNTTQKAKQIKILAPKEQQEAIEQLIKKSTIPEIKGLALSGLKSEVMQYLLSNSSPENILALKELAPMMSPNEKTHFEEMMKTIGGNNQHQNFFIK